MARRGPILVVEDDHDIRVSLRQLLDDAGYEVQSAAHGRQAMEMLRNAERRAVVIVLDLQMPVMDGWELVDQLRADPELCKVPVIIETVDDSHAPSGVAHVLKKPFRGDRLIALIDQYCK